MTSTLDRIRSLIRDIPDFPKPGVLFKDIAPLLQDGPAFRSTVELLAARFSDDGVQYVAAPEARGFIFGAALASRLGCGFVPIRKPNKLPSATTSVTYGLEYGTDTVHIHSDAIQPGDRVVMVDDVLATGGTMAACAKLVGSLGGIILGCGFLMELRFLEGRVRLKD